MPLRSLVVEKAAKDITGSATIYTPNPPGLTVGSDDLLRNGLSERAAPDRTERVRNGNTGVTDPDRK
jgi:hypothetical protein